MSDQTGTIFISCADETNNLIILLESALFWAERGYHVWVITLEQITHLPPKWTLIPKREILNNMMFLCLSNHVELFNSLSKIQLHNKTPKIIIISHLDRYFHVPNRAFDISLGALCCAISVESAQVCSRKLGEKTYFLSTFKSEENETLLQSLINLYFPKNVFKIDDTNCTEIISKLKDIYIENTIAHELENAP